MNVLACKSIINMNKIYSLNNAQFLLNYDEKNKSRSGLKILKVKPFIKWKKSLDFTKWKGNFLDLYLDYLDCNVNNDNCSVIFIADSTGLMCLNGKNGRIIWKLKEYKRPLRIVKSDNKFQLIVLDPLKGEIEFREILTGEVIKKWKLPFHSLLGITKKNYKKSYFLPCDLNKDGNLEIIGIIHTYFRSHVVCLNANGRKKWSYGLCGHSLYNKPAVGDVNNDGNLEILIHAHDPRRNKGCSETLFCISSKGKLLWKYKFSPPDSLLKKFKKVNDFGYISTIIDDFNKDGELEVFSGTDTCIYLLNSKGELIWKTPTGVFSVGESVIVKGNKILKHKPPHSKAPHFLVFDAAAGDLNNDGYVDIVIGLSSDANILYDKTSNIVKVKIISFTNIEIRQKQLMEKTEVSCGNLMEKTQYPEPA
jgi:outer membrane protein assembly factor BamB